MERETKCLKKNRTEHRKSRQMLLMINNPHKDHFHSTLNINQTN